jgi:hypothetical protein
MGMTRLVCVAALIGGLVGSAACTVLAQDASDPALSPQTQKINELIAKGWEAAGIKLPPGKTTPTDKASDLEFMRRVFIDLIGRIPTPEEIRDFERDRSKNRRSKLISRLLYESQYVIKDPRSGKSYTSIPGLKTNAKGEINYNDAYAENFADLWTTWLLTRSNTHPLYREQLRLWLTQQFASTTRYPEGRPWKSIVEELISASGKTNDDAPAAVFVIRHLGEPIAAEMGAKPDYVRDGKFDAVPITSRVTRLFLGIQSQCTQCHDHPFNSEYVQSDFWGVNAFFRQTDRSGTTNPRNLGQGVTPPPLTLSDVSSWNTTSMVRYERRDGQLRSSFPVMLKDLRQAAEGSQSTKRLIPGNIPTNLQGKTRRQILAQWVTEHDNFCRAFVNRMWGHLFGRGLNKQPAVDDFSLNNEVIHPELLDYLAQQFQIYNYDPKKLLEWICNSDVYQLSHVANKAYADTKYDPYFARMPLKAMSPEVLFESLLVATRAESRYAGEDKVVFDRLKTQWIQKLTQNFGDDEGNEINFNGTVVQALLMMNGREINNEIGVGLPKGKTSRDSAVVNVLRQRGTEPRVIYEELFLMTVNRRPTSEELEALEQVRKGTSIRLGSSGMSSSTGGRPPKGSGDTITIAPATDPVTFYQDVFWALLNSAEFMLNH